MGRPHTLLEMVFKLSLAFITKYKSTYIGSKVLISHVFKVSIFSMIILGCSNDLIIHLLI